MRTLAAAAMGLLVSGCLSFGAIDKRGTNVNVSFGAMQNRSVLLNLVRASRYEPLYFLQVNQVTAQGASDVKLAAPGFNLGPLQTPTQKLTAFSSQANVLDNSTNTNLTVQPYNTQAFYSGMLQPLGLDEVDLLLHQGFPRELIFYLVIEKVKLTYQDNGETRIISNDPTNASYPLFKSAIQSAMDHGLTTEVPQPQNDRAGDEGRSQSPSGIAQVTQPPGGSEKGPPPHAQLCFEKALATEDAMDEFAKLQVQKKAINFCGGRHAAHLTVMLFGRETEVEVTTRSVYGLFSYLGRVLSLADSEKAPRLVDFGADYQTQHKDIAPPERTPEGPLLVVTAGEPFGDSCFAAVAYAGRRYCVPEEGSEVTRDIFNVLTVLVGLKQSPGALPSTGSLLIAP